MKRNLLTVQLTWRGILAVLAVLAATGGLFYGGRSIYQQLQSRPKSAAAVKREIFQFLKDKSGARDLAINLQQTAALDAASLSNELVNLRAEVTAFQANLAALQAELRTNREEIAAQALEVRRLKRAAGILPRKNKPLAAKPETNAPPAALSTNAAQTAAVSTNAEPVPAQAAASLTNLTFDLAAASLTNDSLKIILEKDQALSARQNRFASLQKEVNALSFKLNARQRAITAKDKELNALQNGAAIDTKIARQLQQQIQEAMSWELLYKAFGQKLWLAGHLLASTNLETRQNGLQLADQARAEALNTAENGWLASRIIEAFIWPNLSLADTKPAKTASRDQLLVSTGLTFQQAGETNNYIKNAEMLISQSSNPVRADYARFRLANTLEMMGKYEAALKQLRAIQSSNSLVYAAKRIPILEGKLKSKLKKKG